MTENAAKTGIEAMGETPGGIIGRGPLDIDWGEQWAAEQRLLAHDDNPEYWDKRAPKFGTKRGVSPYQVAFVEKLALEPGDTVFDMGCGNGGIAIPLAKAGYRVIARDFSSGMLAELAREAEAAGVADIIDAAQMSWEDDWAAHGITDGMVDVAFASRSVITSDLKASLLNLSRVARKRACVTVSTGATPHVSCDILRMLGATKVNVRDAVYTFNILVQAGYNPEVSYITSTRYDAYDSPEDALAAMERMVEAGAAYISAEDLATCRANLPAWLEANLVPNENAGTRNSRNEVEGPWRLAVAREVTWAFISWDGLGAGFLA